MPRILQIERESYACPWDEDRFNECLGRRNCIAVVAERGEDLVGYMIYELHKTKLQMLRLAVHPDFRCLGVGTRMVDRLKNKLSRDRRPHVLAHVDERNVQAQLFLRGMGFKAIQIVRPSWDQESNGDAYVMQYAIEPTIDDILRSRLGTVEVI